MYIPQFDIPKFEDRHPIRARVCKKNIVIDYGEKHLCFMLSVKALVVRLVEENTHRARTPVYPNLRNVEFIAKFLASNATLQCTLQDRLQSHHIVPGNELSLTIVGVREEIGALLVDVDEDRGSGSSTWRRPTATRGNKTRSSPPKNGTSSTAKACIVTPRHPGGMKVVVVTNTDDHVIRMIDGSTSPLTEISLLSSRVLEFRDPADYITRVVISCDGARNIRNAELPRCSNLCGKITHVATNDIYNPGIRPYIRRTKNLFGLFTCVYSKYANFHTGAAMS